MLAVPLVLRQDLSASPRIVAFIASGESAALQGGATEVLRTTLDTYHGRLQLTATITDAATQQNRTAITLQAATSNVIPLANALARRIDPKSTAMSANAAAFRLFTQAAYTADLAARANLLRQSLATDPNFGLGYIVLLETLARSGEDVVPLMAQTEAHAATFTTLERLRFAALRLQLSHAPLAQTAQGNAAVVAATPNDPDQLTTLASQRYLQGNAQEGDALIQRALRISPGNTAIRQQYVQGLVETRRFHQAEREISEVDNNPAVLPQLAFCVLLEGDPARANSIAEKFFASLQNADVRNVFHGSWLAMSGDPEKAIAYAKQANFTDTGIRSLALSQAALWQAAAGDFADAEKLSAAANSAGGPGPGPPSFFWRGCSAGSPLPHWRGAKKCKHFRPAELRLRRP